MKQGQSAIRVSDEDLVDDKPEGGDDKPEDQPKKSGAKKAAKPKAVKAPDKPARETTGGAAASAPEKAPPRSAGKSEPPAAGNGELFDTNDKSAKEREKFAGDVVRILSELHEAEDTLAVAAVLGVWDAVLRDMQNKFPDLYQEVDDAAEARLAEQKGG